MQQGISSSPASFIIVGSLAAGVHMLVAWAIVESGWAAPAWANVSAFACAFAVSFFGHRRYTFGSSDRLSANLAKWLAVSMTGFALNQTLYVAALHFFPHVFYLLLLFVVTAMIAVVSYCLGKFWAFAPIA